MYEVKTKKKGYFNKREIRVIQSLHKKGGSMTPYEISRASGVAFVTVKKILKKLLEEDIIEKEKNG